MNQKQIARQLLALNKTAFDNTVNALTLLREQNERLITRSLEKITWLPEEGKKAYTQWMDFYKKTRENSKAMADAGYKKIVQYLDQAENKQKPTAM
jgi:hypothetical protein